MESTNSLIDKLRLLYPAITFKKDRQARWAPSENTIYFDPSEENEAILLHELAHYILKHDSYKSDIDLIKMERDAWEKAKDLSVEYGIPIDEETLQDHLDSYREWLHARSTCPSCHATGHQTKPSFYRCVACDTTWKVNEARTCGLKRYTRF